jgi:hypothetical protein
LLVPVRRIERFNDATGPTGIIWVSCHGFPPNPDVAIAFPEQLSSKAEPDQSRSRPDPTFLPRGIRYSRINEGSVNSVFFDLPIRNTSSAIVPTVTRGYANEKIYDTGTIIAVGEVLQHPDHRPGSTFTIRGTAATSSGSMDVAVKGISGLRLANEIAAAWVAEKLQLPAVAKVLLVDDPEAKLAVAAKPIGGGVAGRWLATKFSPIPIFSAPQDYSKCQALAGTQTFREIIVFDVLIANTDRMVQNLLWSDADVRVLDHDKAFSGGNWTAATLSQDVGTAPIGSFMETDIHFADQTSRAAIIELANEWAGAITAADVTDLDELAQLGVISHPEVHALKMFIVARSANLPTLVQEVINRNVN